jgi:hypothetical protein
MTRKVATGLSGPHGQSQSSLFCDDQAATKYGSVELSCVGKLGDRACPMKTLFLDPRAKFEGGRLKHLAEARGRRFQISKPTTDRIVMICSSATFSASYRLLYDENYLSPQFVLTKVTSSEHLFLSS